MDNAEHVLNKTDNGLYLRETYLQELLKLDSHEVGTILNALIDSATDGQKHDANLTGT